MLVNNHHFNYMPRAGKWLCWL
uniref:Uncharacterized protein n=1 Tax=Rhizophora mucronata TaxID=61149 RepID=A0A2P2PHE7_RHIMU